MTKRVRLILVIGSIAVLAAVALAVWLAEGGLQRKASVLPGTDVRTAVSKLTPSDIALLQLDVFLHPAGIITVRDPRIIAILLNGLKKAVIPNGPCWEDGDDTILLVLKNGKTVGPFLFNPGRRAECLGPAFIKGLKAAGVEVGPSP